MVKIISLLFGLILLPLNSLAANITVEVDRDPVSIDESFKIFFFADDRITDTPDFSPLQQDFEILSRTQSSSTKYSNGNLSKKTRWNLGVMAKRSGTLTIPSIAIGNDNSPSISITVNESNNSAQNEANQNAEIFIEVDISPSSVYVQQQVIYSVRFFRAVSINAAGMSEPSINDAEVVIEKLGDDASYETYRNGRRYIVIERKYALFPQQSGSITIEPITLDAQVSVTTPGVFDPFGQKSTTKRLKSNSIKLDVKPIPSSIHSHSWLPTSDLKMTENWSQQPPVFIVGEPITRTLTLKADGLTAAQLPSLNMTDTQVFKTYPDQPRLNNKPGSRGISGTRQEKIALIPTQAGQFTLPEIQVNWWNINSNKLETATLPARTVQVQPGANTLTANTPAAIETPAKPAIIAPTTTAATTPTVTVVKETSSIYSTLNIFLGLGWFITGIAWFISKRHHKTTHNADLASQKQPAKISLKAVKNACLSHNPQQTQIELLNWANGHWPDNPPTNIGEIGRRLDPATQQEIKHLNQALYGSSSDRWQGNGLWQHLPVAAKTIAKKPDKQKERLMPLYP